jgi:hypothetical protein
MVINQILIHVNLEPFQVRINLLPESHPIEFIEHRLMGPLADPVGLGTLGFRPRMLDLIQLEEQFVRMLIGGPAELRPPVRQNP